MIKFSPLEESIEERKLRCKYLKPKRCLINNLERSMENMINSIDEVGRTTDG